MINTRKTIFETLKKRIRELTKHANYAPLEFKKIILAVILNDLKEWSEYIPKDDSDKIVLILENYIMNNCFIINRMPTEDNFAYVNVNTPQTNDTWSRIWDKTWNQTPIPESTEEPVYAPWTPDPSCEVTIVYFGSKEEIKANPTTGAPLINVDNLTTCEKMNIYINRDNGTLWYLDTDGIWKQIEDKGMTEERVIELIRSHRGKINRTWTNSNIELEILDDQSEANSNLELLTINDVEEML